MNIEQKLNEIVAVLDELNIPHLVMGGHAVRYYGFHRETTDHDLYIPVEVGPQLTDLLRHTSLFLGGLPTEAPTWRGDDFRRFVLGALPDGKEELLEFWIRNHLLDDFANLYQRREEGLYGARTVSFLSLPDLIRSKETEREDDWRDISILEEILDQRNFAAVKRGGEVVAALSRMRSIRGLELATSAGLLAQQETAEAARRSDCRLWWLDRQGKTMPLSDKVQSYGTPRLAPNGQHLAISVPGHATDLWSLELGNGNFKQLTFGQTNTVPLWTPDNRRLVFSSDLAGAPLNLYWKAADGSDNAERLTTSSNLQLPGTFTPDGRTLLFTEIDPRTRNDLWALDVSEPAATRRPRPLRQTEADEAQPALSPDGRWLAYTRKESGQWQI